MVFVGYYCCHSLRGLCGLKFKSRYLYGVDAVSQPARAVWIEINMCLTAPVNNASQPARAVWIEICSLSNLRRQRPSQPARAVWIEISIASVNIGNPKGSQPARAVWIEIFNQRNKLSVVNSHSLRGLCGLKY